MELPTITGEQVKLRKRINTIEFAVREAIDKICEDEEFQVTYAEINCALIRVLQSNNGYEIKELMKSKK